jgi:uncharacterized protein with PIN domain
MEKSNEAPASVTYSISRNGFNILFTVRDDSGLTLLDRMEAIEKKLNSLGYIPQVKKTFGEKKPVEYVEGKVCPKCGKRLIVVNNDKIESKCEGNKWNPVTKQSEGCDFVNWKN